MYYIISQYSKYILDNIHAHTCMHAPQQPAHLRQRTVKPLHLPSHMPTEAVDLLHSIYARRTETCIHHMFRHTYAAYTSPKGSVFLNTVCPAPHEQHTSIRATTTTSSCSPKNAPHTLDYISLCTSIYST